VVKNVELLEVTLDELGGEEPAAENEVTIRGILRIKDDARSWSARSMESYDRYAMRTSQ
jgi:hypothetical protein